MRKHFISVSFLVASALLVVSCQKESEMGVTSVAATFEVRTVQYFVDGIPHTTTINNENEWDAFMQTVFALSRRGSHIRIVDENHYSYAFSIKEKIVYTTKNEAEASKWVQNKVFEGYQVSMVYNKDTGEYTCIATR